jgi:hypothetical protein
MSTGRSWHGSPAGITFMTCAARPQPGPLADGPFLAAKQSVTVTITFLAWLQQRGQTLAGCTQHDIDAWYASGPGTRHKAERFLYWCRTQRLTRSLDIPRRSNGNP